jgi:UDP-N-acetylglucosamine/UDP-N-acetyl-alpha-D-glucosaminouronate 4-epimerase
MLNAKISKYRYLERLLMIEIKDKNEIWLVTGGAGFIGSNIVYKLVELGAKVRVIDNFSTGKKENLSAISDKVEVMEGDITNPDDIKRAMVGASYVFHEAAMGSVPKSVDRPFDSHNNNATGTLNVLIAAKEAKIKRLVYASSSSAYGKCEVFPQKEDFRTNPVSPYAVAKLAAEHYCTVFYRQYGLETVSLRYFNVFGPRQNPGSRYSAVIPKFMELAKAKKPLEIHWDGKQSRDFSYVDNVVQANLKAMISEKAPGNFYNIACGGSISLLEIADMLEKVVGYKLERNFMPQRAGDVRKSFADISKAKADLGYEPLVGFEEGLKKTWEYFKNR